MPVGLWHDIIGDQTIADAILDRLVNDAHLIELKGDSLRRKKNLENEEAEN
jgi:DNA replication protein DnaC